MKAAVLTVSDGVLGGTREDTSGDLLAGLLEADGYEVERMVVADEADLRPRLRAPALNRDQALYVSGPLKTGRVMVKDEDVCLHCGLCAERCPTGAWDMQKFLLEMTHAGRGCRPRQREAA